MSGALCLALLAGCEERGGVALTVKGLRSVPTFQSLRVTVQRDRDEPKVLEPFSREALGVAEGSDEVVVGIALSPPISDGALQVTVAATNPDQAWVLGQGVQGDIAPRRGRTEAAVTIARQDLCSASGWCWEHPTPSGRLLYAIWGSSPKDVWAAGHFGTLLHFDGRFWSPVPLPDGAEVDLYGLWGSGRDDVWAVGGTLVGGSPDFANPRGTVLHFDGQAWRAVPGLPTGTALVLSVTGGGRGEAWVTGVLADGSAYDAFLQRCTPEGCDAATERLSTIAGAIPMGRGTLYGLWSAGTPGAPLWAVGYYGTLNKERGVVLRRLPGEPWRLFHALPEGRALTHVWGSGQDLWAAKFHDPYPGIPQGGGAQSVWYHKGADQDSQWTDVTATEKVFPLWQDAKGTRWGRAVPDQGVSRLAAGEGAAWSAQPLDAQLTLFGTAPDDVWVSGNHGQLRHYGGARWDAPGALPLIPGSLPYLHGMYARSTTDVWAVGEKGTILHYDGGAWLPEDSKTQEELRGVAGFGGEVWAVGRKGTMLRRRGGAWQAESVPTTSDLYDVWGAGPGDLWAVGDGGTLLRWDDVDGGRWTAVRTTGPRLHGVWGAGGAAGPRWAVGCSNPGTTTSVPVALRLRAGVWEDVPPPQGSQGSCFQSVWFLDESKIWVGGGIYYFDGAKGQWGKPISLSGVGRFSGTDGGDLWMPGGDSVFRGSETKRTVISIGTYSQLFPGGHLLLLGEDRWYYGYGIIHCRKGYGCAAPRR